MKNLRKLLKGNLTYLLQLSLHPPKTKAEEKIEKAPWFNIITHRVSSCFMINITPDGTLNATRNFSFGDVSPPLTTF